MKKHILFDFDDTLADSHQYSFFCYKETIQKFNPKIPETEIYQLFNLLQGTSIDDMYKKAIEQFKLNTPINKLLSNDKELMKGGVKKMPLFSHVPEMLETLRKNDKYLHICTNRSMELLNPILEQTNIKNLFKNIISCKDEGHKKPDPTCLNRIIKKNGGIHKDFIYFGDSEIDKEFAINANIDFIIIDQYLNQKKFFKNLVLSFA